MTAIKLAVLPPVRAGVCADPDWMIDVARHAEALGFESIVVVEHPLVIGGYTSHYPYSETGRMPLPDQCPVPDPVDLLAFIAAATTTLHLATGVLILPAHHPVILAKRLATVDRLSKGRLRVCIGLGWMREEIEACGAHFDTRGRRTDESIDALRALWAECGDEGASFKGDFFAFDRAHSYPKPVHRNGVAAIPIHIGGHSTASVLRAARRGDGWHPLGVEGEELLSLVSLLRDEAKRVGRDPEQIELTLTTLADRTDESTLEKVRTWGVDRLVITCTQREIEAAKDQLSGVAQRVGLGEGGLSR